MDSYTTIKNTIKDLNRDIDAMMIGLVAPSPYSIFFNEQMPILIKLHPEMPSNERIQLIMDTWDANNDPNVYEVYKLFMIEHLAQLRKENLNMDYDDRMKSAVNAWNHAHPNMVVKVNLK